MSCWLYSFLFLLYWSHCAISNMCAQDQKFFLPHGVLWSWRSQFYFFFSVSDWWPVGMLQGSPHSCRMGLTPVASHMLLPEPGCHLIPSILTPIVSLKCLPFAPKLTHLLHYFGGPACWPRSFPCKHFPCKNTQDKSLFKAEQLTFTGYRASNRSGKLKSSATAVEHTRLHARAHHIT